MGTGLYVDLEDALNMDFPLQEQEHRADSLFLRSRSPSSIASSHDDVNEGSALEKRARSGHSGLSSWGRRKVIITNHRAASCLAL
jgi:hypothetical protein